MTRGALTYILVTLLSYFGDIIAVVAIPLLLLKLQGSLVYSSCFTVLALISIVVTSRLSSAALKQIHPIRIILYSDIVSCALLFILAHSEDLASKTPIYFLAVCFLCALAINFPMFAKNQLLYQYFVRKENMIQATSLQGKLNGGVFALSVVSIGLVERLVGFKGIIYFDILTYLPLLLICFKFRNASTLGYDTPIVSSANLTVSSMPAQSPEVKNKAKLMLQYYLIFNFFSFFFNNLRSHLGFSVLATFFPGSGLLSLGLALALGTLLSLTIDKFTRNVFAKSTDLTVISISTAAVLIGCFLKYADATVSAIGVGFLLTEISALALIRMRVFHTNASHHFSKEDLAFYATISGSLLAASAIYGAANLIVFKGALISFFIIGLATGMFYLFIRQQNYKELLSAILILFISVSAFSSAKNNESVFDYVTVMLDKPRLFSTLGSRSMSEDERFVLNNINCGLFKLETGKGLVPELVSEWNIEDAGRQYRFKIKPGQRDSEGVQIDGRYIIESLKVLIQEAKSMPLNSILASDTRGYSQILGFDECNNKNCHLKGIFGKNDEVVIKLKKRWPGFLELLTRQMAPIVRSKISANNIAIPVGCGPYRVKSYSNKDLELQRNPFFQVPNEHELPQNFRIRFESPEQAYRGFCNGEFNDLLFLVPTKSDLERARCTQSEFLWHETNTAGFWLINLESKKLRQRPQVIAALKESLNAKRFRQTWNISSPKQYSIIPGVFGNYENLGDETPSVQNNVSNKKMAKILNEEVLVRFIDGTPEPQNLLRALKEWQEYSGVKFRIEATPFSDFMLDLTEGKSDVYIYAELADAKLANFLSSFYEATLRSINKDQVENLKAAWNEYQAQESTRAILDLNRLILGTKLYTPLFVFRRPLVFKKGYYIRRHSEIGLAALSILEFRRGLQKP